MDLYDEPDFWLNLVTVTGPALLFLIGYCEPVPLAGEDTISACSALRTLLVFVMQPTLAVP